MTTTLALTPAHLDGEVRCDDAASARFGAMLALADVQGATT
ncbi:hypothetical protein [Reyranella sp.]